MILRHKITDVEGINSCKPPTYAEFCGHLEVGIVTLFWPIC